MKGQVLGHSSGVNGDVRGAVHSQDAAAAVGAGHGAGDVDLAAGGSQVFGQEFACGRVVVQLHFVFPLLGITVVVGSALVDQVVFVAHDLVVCEGPSVPLPLAIQGIDAFLVIRRENGLVGAVAALDEAVDDDVLASQVDIAACMNPGTFIRFPIHNFCNF